MNAREEKDPGAMRLDRLLVYLRLVRTRSAASRLIATRALRRNRIRVQRGCEKVAIGDVLTLPWGDRVRLIEVVSLPQRRGSPAFAQSHYRDLDLTNAHPLAAPSNFAGPISLAKSPAQDTKDL